ncbi:secretin [Platysternon megacephalum]|uniref:Secretin n=1 Tax=Platysternon megacephalum TaxID=55544 RepID=A0A4D9DYA1_9SAUR|nr:secretin [Platysternon megacephalum]
MDSTGCNLGHGHLAGDSALPFHECTVMVLGSLRTFLPRLGCLSHSPSELLSLRSEKHRSTPSPRSAQCPKGSRKEADDGSAPRHAPGSRVVWCSKGPAASVSLGGKLLMGGRAGLHAPLPVHCAFQKPCPQSPYLPAHFHPWRYHPSV